MLNIPESFMVSTITKSDSYFMHFSSFLRSLPEPTGPKIKNNDLLSKCFDYLKTIILHFTF